MTTYGEPEGNQEQAQPAEGRGGGGGPTEAPDQDDARAENIEDPAARPLVDTEMSGDAGAARGRTDAWEAPGAEESNIIVELNHPPDGPV